MKIILDIWFNMWYIGIFNNEIGETDE